MEEPLRLELPYKLSTFMWKIYHKAVPVKEELTKSGILCDAQCIL